MSTSCTAIGLQGPAGPQGLPGYGAGNGGWFPYTPDGSSNIHPDLANGLTVFIPLQSGTNTTGTAASGSPIVTIPAGTTGISNGMPVAGYGIPNGTTVLTFSGVTMTLSKNTTAALTGTTPIQVGQITVQQPTWTTQFILPGMMFYVVIKQDTTGNRPTPVFVVGPHAFTFDSNTKYPISLGGLYSIWQFMYDGTVWINIAFWTNIASQ